MAAKRQREPERPRVSVDLTERAREALSEIAVEFGVSASDAVELLVRHRKGLPPFDRGHDETLRVLAEHLGGVGMPERLTSDDQLEAAWQKRWPKCDRAHLVCRGCGSNRDIHGECLNAACPGEEAVTISSLDELREEAAARRRAATPILAPHQDSAPGAEPAMSERKGDPGLKMESPDPARVKNEGGEPIPIAPVPAVVFAPPAPLGPVVREPTFDGSPEWTRRVLEDLSDGAIVEPDAQEALRLWRHGVDVPCPVSYATGGE